MIDLLLHVLYSVTAYCPVQPFKFHQGHMDYMSTGGPDGRGLNLTTHIQHVKMFYPQSVNQLFFIVALVIQNYCHVHCSAIKKNAETEMSSNGAGKSVVTSLRPDCILYIVQQCPKLISANLIQYD